MSERLCWESKINAYGAASLANHFDGMRFDTWEAVVNHVTNGHSKLKKRKLIWAVAILDKVHIDTAADAHLWKG